MENRIDTPEQVAEDLGQWIEQNEWLEDAESGTVAFMKLWGVFGGLFGDTVRDGWAVDNDRLTDKEFAERKARRALEVWDVVAGLTGWLEKYGKDRDNAVWERLSAAVEECERSSIARSIEDLICFDALEDPDGRCGNHGGKCFELRQLVSKLKDQK